MSISNVMDVLVNIMAVMFRTTQLKPLGRPHTAFARRLRSRCLRDCAALGMLPCHAHAGLPLPCFVGLLGIRL